MKLEFNIYKMNEDCRLFKMVSKFNTINEFIIVGEEKVDGKEYVKVHQLTNNGLRLIRGLPLEETAHLVEKSNLKLAGEDWYKDSVEIDIPSEYLSMELIENIQRLNS